MRVDAVFSELEIHSELHQRLMNLLGNARKDYGHSPLMGSLAKVAEVVDTCRVNEWHLTHSDDTYLCSWLLHLLKLLKAACKSEEERTVDLINLHSLRNVKFVCILH